MTAWPGEDDVPGDIASQELPRRLWRRVWIGLAVFVLAAPLLLWIAVDQGGKREWTRVRSELQARGVATDFAELAAQFPLADEVPDEENFCAIAWLTSNRSGDASVAMEEMDTALRVFDGNASGLEESWKMGSAALSGVPTDLTLWAAHFLEIQARDADLAALLPAATGNMSREEERRLRIRQIAEADERLEEGRALSEAEAIEIVAEALGTFHPSVWEDLRQALSRSESCLLPEISQRMADLNSTSGLTMSPAVNNVLKLVKTVRLRMLVATKDDDRETVRECIEIGTRFCEAASREPFFIGHLVTIAIASETLAGLAEVLWLPSFSEDPEFLLFCQRQLERIDIAGSFRQGYVSEFAYAIEGVKEQKEEREYQSYYDEISAVQEAWLRVAPAGWFDQNLALLGDLNSRFMFPAMDDDFEFYEVRGAADQVAAEIASLSKFERWNSFLVLSDSPLLESFIGRGAYFEARRRQALIVCALRRWRIDHHGELPQSLLQLVPKYLGMPEVLIDPMDGSPLRYRVTEGDEIGLGDFVLYSVGSDQVDNHGPGVLPAGISREELPSGGIDFDDWAWPVLPLVLADEEKSE